MWYKFAGGRWTRKKKEEWVSKGVREGKRRGNGYSTPLVNTCSRFPWIGCSVSLALADYVISINVFPACSAAYAVPVD